MKVTAYNAWRHDERLRKWFEVVFDAAGGAFEHVAYLCKCCWEQLPAESDALSVSGHALSHESCGESPYSSPRPSPITGEQVLQMYRDISEHFEANKPEVGTWKLQCRRCAKLLPHRSTYQELMQHAKTCSMAGIPGRKVQITNPGYISQPMFDTALREKFHDNPNDEAVRRQATKLIYLVHDSRSRHQILADIMCAARVSGHVATEQVAEIGFCMGLQFGFELALSYPPPMSDWLAK